MYYRSKHFYYIFHLADSQALIFLLSFFLFILLAICFVVFLRIWIGYTLIFNLSIFRTIRSYLKYLDFLKSTTCTLYSSACYAWIRFVLYFSPGYVSWKKRTPHTAKTSESSIESASSARNAGTGKRKLINSFCK